jgi:SAM-dependent methyltransferase
MSYEELQKYYEAHLQRHGDSHLGVAWPNKPDADLRHRLMLECAEPSLADQDRLRIIDLGCGTAQLLDYIKDNSIEWVEYFGVDLSPKFIDVCERKYPQERFISADILREPEKVPSGDFVFMNGLFTVKSVLSQNEMLEFFTEVLVASFSKSYRGISFNVMSPHVDWEREDLFHVPLEYVTGFIVRNLSRNFVLRHDYGLYEYMVYVYR